MVIVPGGEDRVLPAKVLKTATDNMQVLGLNLRRGDQAWCVFDTEQEGTHQGLNQIVAQAQRSQVRLAVSNPAFEYWYLLHFEDTNRPFQHASEVITRLCKYIADYDKSMDVFPHLGLFTSQAIRCATRLREQATESWDTFPNPSTGVDLLVRELIPMGLDP